MTRSPVVWSLVQRFGSEALSYATFFVLASLLEPEDFGLLAVASLWIGLVSVFAELGLSSALVQRTSIQPGHLSTAFFLNVGAGALFAGTGVLLSGFIATIFGAPEAQPVVAVLSLGFVLTSVSLTQQALAYRELRLMDIAIRDMIAAIVAGLCAIVLAYRGLGVWSLVVHSLVGNATASLLLWRMSPWRPHLSEVSLVSLQDLWWYSSSVLLFGLFKYASQNIDKILIGRVFGAPTLGLYGFATKLVVYPVSALSGALGKYQFASLSRMQEDRDRVRSSYLLFYRGAATIVVPAMLALAVFSPALIPLVFGESWSAAVPLAQLLTIVGVAIMIISPSGILMKALGRPDWLLWWAIGMTIVTTLSLWLGSSWGIIGAVAGLAAGHLLVLPAVYFLTASLLNVGIGDFLRPFLPSAAAAAVATLVLWLGTLAGALSSNQALVVGGMLMVGAYFTVLLWLDRPLLILVFRRVGGQ